MCHVDEDTFRKWFWYFVSRLANLEPEVIAWENRKLGDQARNCLANYNGIDCPTTKQGPSGKAFYSHKFKSSGLRYGVASSIVGDNIVHVDGPQPPGDWNDFTCFRKYLKPKLEPGEKVEADDRYLGEDPGKIVAPGGIRFMETEATKNAQRRLRSCHETINERLKQFQILSECFCQNILKHGDVFRACAVLSQLSFQYNKGPFEVENALATAGY
ncbi:hypothetical protein ACA910_004764 [Epithemia clementina (nom. ined.)]